jgi:DNA replication and repair protein RecF
MFISSLTIKQFRCFKSKSLDFTKSLVLIEGPNGSGKTSLLEALHYSCYLRSFKTRTTRELMQFGSNAFSIKIQVTPPNSATTDLHVGYSPEKRSVKINDAPIESYKDLIASYRVISITDDDLFLIKGSPELRRSFLDQAITLTDSSYPSLLRKYSAILEQRNALLQAPYVHRESYDLWTNQLCEVANLIREKRHAVIAELNEKINELLVTYFTNQDSTPTPASSAGARAGGARADGTLHCTLVYKPREMPTHSDFQRQEQAARHTLFGAHLDDCSILISDKSSKHYASRGQQKLITLLLKLAQPATKNPDSCVFLLDDVVSDLDADRLSRLFKLLTSYKTQIIITSPIAHPLLHALCTPYDYERIILAPTSPENDQKM